MFETLMEMLKELNAVNDVYMRTDKQGVLHVEFNDFAGFDDDWSELPRYYVNPDLVETVHDFLDSFESDDGFYTTYMVDGHAVKVGYTSYDV